MKIPLYEALTPAENLIFTTVVYPQENIQTMYYTGSLMLFNKIIRDKPAAYSIWMLYYVPWNASHPATCLTAEHTAVQSINRN